MRSAGVLDDRIAAIHREMHAHAMAVSALVHEHAEAVGGDSGQAFKLAMFKALAVVHATARDVAGESHQSIAPREPALPRAASPCADSAPETATVTPSCTDDATEDSEAIDRAAEAQLMRNAALQAELGKETAESEVVSMDAALRSLCTQLHVAARDVSADQREPLEALARTAQSFKLRYGELALDMSRRLKEEHARAQRCVLFLDSAAP